MSNHIYPQHYTYEITNKKGNRYIGVRSCNCNPNNDPYMGTCKTLDEAIEIEGKENFTKKILQTFPTRKEAMQHEIDLHKKFDVARNPLFYNEANAKSIGFYYDSTGTKCTDEHKRKVSEAKKGIKRKPFTEETKKKLSDAQKGRNNSFFGKTHSEETKKKISKVRKDNDWWVGNKHTEATKKKMSETAKRRWAKKR